MIIKDTENFKKAIDQLATIVEEGNLHISVSGINVIALDKTNIVFLKVLFPDSVIENSLEPIAVGLNFQEFNKIISKVGNDESINLIIHETEIELKTEGNYSRSYFLPIIEVKDPSIDFKLDKYLISITEKGQVLRDMFRSATTVATSVTFKAAERLDIIADGIQGRFVTNMTTEKEVTPFSVRYSTLQLYNLIKNAGDEINIKLGNNSPLYGKYNIGEISVEFMLAHMLI